jgi:hypothetical protein
VHRSDLATPPERAVIQFLKRRYASAIGRGDDRTATRLRTELDGLMNGRAAAPVGRPLDLPPAPAGAPAVGAQPAAGPQPAVESELSVGPQDAVAARRNAAPSACPASIDLPPAPAKTAAIGAQPAAGPQKAVQSEPAVGPRDLVAALRDAAPSGCRASIDAGARMLR